MAPSLSRQDFLLQAGVLAGEGAHWYGDRMSLYGPADRPQILRATDRTKLDSGGFIQGAPSVEAYATPSWWGTDMLPEPLRHDTSRRFPVFLHRRKP